MISFFRRRAVGIPARLAASLQAVRRAMGLVAMHAFRSAAGKAATGAARSSAPSRLIAAALKAASKAGRGAAIAAAWARRPQVSPALAGSAMFAMALILLEPVPVLTRAYSSALYASGGELLGASVSSDGQWRFAPSSDAPSVAAVVTARDARYAMAVVEFEDRRFYGHAGFDPLAIARAARSNLRAGRIVSGGSTITMQAARLSRARARRTWSAKLFELWASVRLELRHDKSEILELYAELAPYGGNVVGLEAAGWRWFGRAASDLTWAEAAALAILPNSPGLVHPGRDRSELGRKRDALLYRLAEKRQLDDTELGAALAEPLPRSPRPLPDLAPHILAKAGEGRVETYIDAGLQSRASSIVARHAGRLRRNGIRNAAAVVVRVADGAVIAYIGNSPSASGGAGTTSFYADFEPGDADTRDADLRDAPWVDCADAPRSSGSILKPFLYAAMIDTGELSPSRLVPDIPTRVGSYSPENNLKTYAGAVRADEALARSLNVPFVRLLRSYGVERFASALKRLGFSTLTRSPADYGLTLILGGAETTLVEATAAYAVLARIAGAKDTGSEPGADPFTGYSWRRTAADPKAPDAKATSSAAAGSTAPFTPPFSAGAAYLTLEALLEVPRPDEEASWQQYANANRIAWKTGTSFGSRDAWAVGVTPDYAIGVWAGNADGEGRPELKGSQAAAPLLFDLFQALPRAAWFAEPTESLRLETVCAYSGYVAGPDCVATERIVVPAGAKTDSGCPYCRLVALSDDGRYRVRAEQAGIRGVRLERRFILPPAVEWYYSRSALGYRPLPPWAPDMSGTEADAVEFIAPEAGAAIYVPIELDGAPGMSVFRAAHADPAARLFWHLDGEYLGETIGDHRMQARPLPGAHELTVVDERGSSASRRFQVLARQ